MADIKEMDFEQASKRLNEITSLIESEGISLDNAVKLLDEGKDLIQLCYKKLDSSKGKLTEVKEVLGKLEEF